MNIKRTIIASIAAAITTTAAAHHATVMTARYLIQ